MIIKLGPAGIPSICKGNSIEGIKAVRKLGLSAMEVEFVRGVKMKNETAKELGKVAKENDVELSIHAPYYINLASKEKIKIKESKKRILDSIERGHHMGATVAVVHAGYYGKDKEKANKMIFDACEDMNKIIKKKKWKTLIGLETTGKQGAWGTIDEIIDLCKKIKKCVPVLDSAHIYARKGGNINYKEIFNKLKKLRLKHLHCHFSGMKYSVVGIGKGNERYHLPLKIARGPDFKGFAKEVLKSKRDTTIISESPILEKDSLYMKSIFKKLGYKFK
ncbi:MAG: TIM barrel protein [Candidatus Aenigmatarchaeota archaeon]